MASVQQASDVLTLQEAAEYLRVSESIVRRYADRLAIPGRQLDEEWRFSRMALEEWLRTASGKEILLGQAGSFTSTQDEQRDLEALRNAVYKQRGRSETEGTK